MTDASWATLDETGRIAAAIARTAADRMLENEKLIRALINKGWRQLGTGEDQLSTHYFRGMW
jgi:hypothetical protein